MKHIRLPAELASMAVAKKIDQTVMERIFGLEFHKNPELFPFTVTAQLGKRNFLDEFIKMHYISFEQLKERANIQETEKEFIKKIAKDYLYPPLPLFIKYNGKPYWFKDDVNIWESQGGYNGTT